ncbi:L-xylulose reductase-like [Mercenaria mercenaria]|uniref:L-xylulose reductase-like n=1 Tax=Mercenaria mercenaria TaxID=6596 RepID=UPI001E1DD16E|nr:L-xylulose reductase-like [Mercenaria mercenaria]
MPFDFSGKKVLVTGATRGIGRLLTKCLSSAGAEVYGLGSNRHFLDTLKEECKNVHTVHVDLADWDATRKTLEQLPAMNGLVNNAGVSFDWVPSLEAGKDVIDKTFAVNVMAAVNVTQVVGKKMEATGKGGSIVNVSSINGLNPMRECMAYNMSKAALDMMTKQFALELGPHKIRVNSVNPTVALTDMGKEFWSEPVKAGKLKGHTPLGRFAEVQECVDPIMYLLSDHSSMVTGTMNPIEGGLLSNISV